MLSKPWGFSRPQLGGNEYALPVQVVSHEAFNHTVVTTNKYLTPHAMVGKQQVSGKSTTFRGVAVTPRNWSMDYCVGFNNVGTRESASLWVTYHYTVLEETSYDSQDGDQ